MSKRMQSVISVLLIAVMLVSFFPGQHTAMADDPAASDGSTAAEEADRDEAGKQDIPARDYTETQRTNASEIMDMLASAGSEDRNGDFTWRLLSDGTAMITGYSGTAATVSVPLTLGGADVTAIADSTLPWC